jgi:hypothetical protein
MDYEGEPSTLAGRQQDGDLSHHGPAPCFPQRRLPGKYGVCARDRPVPAGGPGPHAGLMALRTAALDLWVAGVLLSLASIVLAGVSWAAVCLLTLARARRQLRQQARCLSALPGMSGDLAEIDEALERILSEERGTLPG